MSDPSGHNSESASGDVGPLVEHLFRREYGKLVAVLISAFGLRDLQLAEDLVQDTLVAALHHWAYQGIPECPEAWLMQVAKNKALNLLKRRKTGQRVHAELSGDPGSVAPEEVFLKTDIEDSLLRMIFACCHPAIPQESQIPLILKMVCGFGTREIAQALLLSEESASKRLYRAKQQIKTQHLSLSVPEGEDLEQFIEPVCTSLYLLYNEGYFASGGNELIRKDLCQEAIRLSSLLARRFPEHSEIDALMALMLLHSARFDSRLDGAGEEVPFAEQDRLSWDPSMIHQGLYFLTRSARGDRLSSYHLEASIAAQYCLTKSFAATDWKCIQGLYEQLMHVRPSPVIQLNLAIISIQIDGAGAALPKLERLLEDRQLRRYSLLHSALGHVHQLQARPGHAAHHLRQALAISSSERERRFIQQRIDALSASPNSAR